MSPTEKKSPPRKKWSLAGRKESAPPTTKMAAMV